MLRIVSYLIIFILINFFGGCNIDSRAEDPELPQDLVSSIDSLIEYSIAEENLPGVAVGIWINGRGNYERGFGKANTETGLVRKFNDPVRIASITKTLTATAILILADKDLLSTSDLLSEYLPDFPGASQITIRNLLRMRSGLSDYTDEELLKEWYNDLYKNYSLDELIEITASRSSEFRAPGQETIYCNANYTILTRIAEIASGKNFATLLDEEIFQPLKLNSTWYPEADVYSVGGSNRGYSLDEVSGELVDVTILNPSCANGAGAVISTPEDLNKIIRMIFNGDLLAAQTQQKRFEMETFAGNPEIFQYGEGILRLGNFYGHTGTIFGFSTDAFYYPPEQAVIVVSVNRLDIDDHSKSTELFFKLSKLVFPDGVDW